MRAATTYLRNFIFGVEDSLVSTVGLLTGVAIAGVEREIVLLTGVVLIVVEALSMAAGSFLSEASAEEFAGRGEEAQSHSIRGGLVMFVSYFAAGFVPLAPYFFIVGPVAIYLSVIFSLTALFMLGVVSGSLAGGQLFKRGLRMMLVGGLATAAGVGAALLLARYGVVA